MTTCKTCKHCECKQKINGKRAFCTKKNKKIIIGKIRRCGKYENPLTNCIIPATKSKRESEEDFFKIREERDILEKISRLAETADAIMEDEETTHDEKLMAKGELIAYGRIFAEIKRTERYHKILKQIVEDSEFAKGPKE